MSHESKIAGVSNEKGSISLLFFVALGAAIAVLKFPEQLSLYLLGREATFIELFAAQVSLFALAGAALLIRLVMLLTGSKTPSEMRGITKRYLKEMKELLNEQQEKLAAVEEAKISSPRLFTPEAADALERAKRIVRALDERYLTTAKLLKSRRAAEAYDLFCSELPMAKNCFEGLIDYTPMPNLLPHQWEPTLRFYFSIIEEEFSRKIREASSEMRYANA